MGRRIEQMDALIPAIVLAHDATRDANGFADLGRDVVNAFEAIVAR